MMVRFGFPITGAGAQIQLYSPDSSPVLASEKRADLAFYLHQDNRTTFAKNPAQKATIRTELRIAVVSHLILIVSYSLLELPLRRLNSGPSIQSQRARARLLLPRAPGFSSRWGERRRVVAIREGRWWSNAAAP